MVWLFLVICLVAFLGILGCTKEVKEEAKKAEEVEKVEKEVLPEKEIMLEKPGKPVEEKVLPQAELLEEPEEVETGVIEFMQGRVKGIDPDMREIMVGSIWFDAGSLDLTKFHIGDLVEVTYTKKKHGKVIESIEVLEKR